MGTRRHQDVGMGEVATWREALRTEHNVRARIVWSTGAHPGEWRVTAQGVVVIDGRPQVVGEVYDVWPKRGCSSVEALMLQLLVTLERSFDLDRPLMVGEAAAA